MPITVHSETAAAGSLRWLLDEVDRATQAPFIQLATHLSKPPAKPTAPAKPAVPAKPKPKAGAVSGLTWDSGMSCYDGRFDQFRGRPSDTYVAFIGNTYRKDIVAKIRSNEVGRFAKMPGRLALSWPMLPTEIPHKFAECARGHYDQFVKDAASALKAHGFVDPIVRLGFEANGRFTWSLGKYPDRVDQYKACFQRQVRLFRSILPGVKIEWTNRRDGVIPYSIERAYPGDAYVDIIGMMLYDRWPAHPNQKAWDAAYKLRDKFGGPKGLGTYLDYARKLKKPLAISEWGVSSRFGDVNSVDNPFFIEKMHEFFRVNAASIAYDAYFNCGDPSKGYKLAPNTVNPKAAARYKELWTRGAVAGK